MSIGISICLASANVKWCHVELQSSCKLSFVFFLFYFSLLLNSCNETVECDICEIDLVTECQTRTGGMYLGLRHDLTARFSQLWWYIITFQYEESSDVGGWEGKRREGVDLASNGTIFFTLLYIACCRRQAIRCLFICMLC